MTQLWIATHVNTLALQKTSYFCGTTAFCQAPSRFHSHRPGSMPRFKTNLMPIHADATAVTARSSVQKFFNQLSPSRLPCIDVGPQCDTNQQVLFCQHLILTMRIQER